MRTRGINLAIVTLGLGSAIELVLFGNTDFTGGFGGTQIGEPSLFGLNINAASHPTRYGLIALGCLVVVALIVGNLRRGQIRAKTDRGAHQRARRGGARDQRPRGEALRLRRRRGDRRPRHRA